MKFENKNVLLIFLLPAFVFIILFSSLPTLMSFSISLFKINFFEQSKFIGLKNFVRLFSDKYFYSALLNSFVYLLVTPILAIISLTLAVLIKDLNRGQNFLKTIYFLPVVTPIVISGIIWRYIFNEDSGILNYFISSLFNSKINWLTSYPENVFSVMILTIWRGFGYYLIIFFAGLDGDFE
jgi:putative chitobiose transport system permease protein